MQTIYGKCKISTHQETLYTNTQFSSIILQVYAI